jgi:hypothetical protein
MTDKEKLDEAIEQLKSQMAKDKQKDDWKEAYLHGIAYHKQTLNKTRGIEWQN